jgi:hypothetical protein
MTNMTNDNMCLMPTCNTHHRCRGLCHTHYSIASRLVSDGRTTWEELIKTGRAVSKLQMRRDGSTRWFLGEEIG